MCFTSMDHTAIHLNVLSSQLQDKANLVFCSTAIAAMQLPGEGNRITQSECAGGGRKAEDKLAQMNSTLLVCSAVLPGNGVTGVKIFSLFHGLGSGCCKGLA